MSESISNLLQYKGFHVLKPCTRKLIGFLSHQDSKLREEGAKALGKIGDPEAILPLSEAILKERQDTGMPEALAKIGNESVFNNLVEAFNTSDREVRPNIALALGNFRKDMAVELLISGLSDLDVNVRYACVTSLGKIKAMDAVSYLLGCLGESNEWLFLNVIDALAKIGSHKATNPLIAFYARERNERKRAAVISALGQLGDLTAVATLTRALKDSDDRVKANAIEGLARLGLPRDKVFGLIQPFFRYPSNRVRGNALVAASKIGKSAELSVNIRSMADDPDKWVRATLAYILSVVDCEEGMEYIVELLKDEEPDVRKNAAKSLNARANDAQVDILVRMLSDSVPFVRLQAIIILGRLRVTPVAPRLISMLETERNNKIRASIVASLGHIGGAESAEILKNALHDRDSRIRANAVEGLEEILGEKAIPIIRPMLLDSDNRTKANAAKALFRLGEIEVVSELESMLSSRDFSLKISAAYSVAQLGDVLSEIVHYPLKSILTSKLEKVELPVLPKIIRAAIGDIISEPTIGEVSEVQDKISDNALPVPERSPAAIREELRENYEALQKVGKLKEALDAVEAFIVKFPYDLKGLTFAGNLYFKLSRFEDVITIFNRVLDQDPFNIQAFSNLGTAYYRNNQIDSAIDSYKKALKLKPDLSVIRFNLASIFLKNGKWQDAIRQYEEGLRYQQPNARILGNLALAYQKTSDFDKAAEIYRKVIAIDSHDANAYYNLAVILNNKGKTNEALVILRRSLSAIENGTPGFKNLSDFYDRLRKNNSL